MQRSNQTASNNLLKSVSNVNGHPFAQLKSALDAGTIDRKRHWKLFQQALQIARNSSPTDEEIKILDHIDDLFYGNWNVRKLSMTKGTLAFFLLTIASEVTYWLFLKSTSEKSLGIGLYMLFSFVSVVASHVIFHWLTGRALGIKFRGYFVSRAAIRKAAFPPFVILAKPPTPGIKYELGSFLTASRWKRTIMLISAPLLTITWFALNYALLIHYFGFQNSLIQLIGLITILCYVGNLVPSYLSGDLRKARLDY
ncbi:MAG: hypothetical protein ACXAB4_02505 [Candidatus Hodarchaeales archaeon]